MKNERADLMRYVFKCLNRVFCMKHRTGTGLAYFEWLIQMKMQILIPMLYKQNEQNEQNEDKKPLHTIPQKKNEIHRSQILCTIRVTNGTQSIIFVSLSIVFFQMQKRLRN